VEHIIGALVAPVIVIGAIFLVIWSIAHEQGLTLKEWLDICDAHSKEEGAYLKKRYGGK